MKIGQVIISVNTVRKITDAYNVPCHVMQVIKSKNSVQNKSDYFVNTVFHIIRYSTDLHSVFSS